MKRFVMAAIAMLATIAANATTLVMVGTPSVTIDTSLSIGATVQNVSSTTSNTVRLEVWAFSSPYSGGALNGSKLGDDGGLAGSIPPGRTWTSSFYTPSFPAPPASTYNIAAVWTEFDGAMTNAGYSPRAYANVGTHTFGASPPPPPSTLENPAPGTFQSGIGLISGWSCQGPVSVSVDGTMMPIPYGGSRADTASACSGTSTTGFGLLVNYNNFGAGSHTAQLYVGGTPRGSPVQFTVTVPNGEFMTGVSKTITVPDFPSPGRTTTLIWQESQQNFAIQSVTPP